MERNTCWTYINTWRKNSKQFLWKKKMNRNRKDTCFDFGYFQIIFLTHQPFKIHASFGSSSLVFFFLVAVVLSLLFHDVPHFKWMDVLSCCPIISVCIWERMLSFNIGNFFGPRLFSFIHFSYKANLHFTIHGNYCSEHEILLTSHSVCWLYTLENMRMWKNRENCIGQWFVCGKDFGRWTN